MNIVINFKRIKWCFNNNNNNNKNDNYNNNNKRRSCMVYLVIHKAFITIIKTPFYPFEIYICKYFTKIFAFCEAFFLASR